MWDVCMCLQSYSELDGFHKRGVAAVCPAGCVCGCVCACVHARALCMHCVCIVYALCMHCVCIVCVVCVVCVCVLCVLWGLWCQVSFSKDGSLLFSVGMDDDHSIACWSQYPHSIGYRPHTPCCRPIADAVGL